MMLFLVLHLANLILGIASVDVMHPAMYLSIDPWRTLPGTIILGSAVSIHLALAFYSLFHRRNFRFLSGEGIQYVSGFALPAFLIHHLLGTRILLTLWDIEGDWFLQLFLFWYLAPEWGIVQAVLLVVAWTHGCIGFHRWLRLKPWYEPLRRPALVFAVLFPTLAGAGYVSAGMEMLRFFYEAPPEAATRIIDDWGMTEAMREWLVETTWLCLGTYFILLCVTVLAGRMHRRRALSRIGVRVAYERREVLVCRPGTCLLTTILSAGIPHASVCGGKGRCSTCRVRVTEGIETLQPPSPTERKVLDRISAPPDVRLACQIHPRGDLEIIALVPSSAGPEAGFSQTALVYGEERELAVLFCDIRSFTQFAENKLPYDVVFVLNRYFEIMGQAIEQAHGLIDKFVGDGVMALFGLDRGPVKGSRDALNAAVQMARGIDELNTALASDLAAPLRVGFGLHEGEVIVGEMGYKESKSFTAIGDPVNTASRLEGMTKDFGVQLIVSKQVFSRAGLDDSPFEGRKVQIRGRSKKLEVVLIPSGSQLSLPEQN
jgi:adenylate cyclase